MITQQLPSYLDAFKEKAARAHNWTSFNPEKRGERLIDDYNSQLTQDIAELAANGISDEVIDSYKQRYITLFNSWLSAKSNCISAFVTGPANFPVRRHEKANTSEERHYTLWQEWRDRAKKAIIRKSLPEKTFLSEIERYKSELSAMQKNHELMKEGNKRIKAALKSGEDITEYLTNTFGIKPHMIEWTMKFGFGLSNNNANMRRVEERIRIMEAKEERAATIGTQEFRFEGVTVIYNHEADRIQIRHDSKPDQILINELKRGGFRWSPSFKAWQRNLNRDGIHKAAQILKVTLH